MKFRIDYCPRQQYKLQRTCSDRIIATYVHSCHSNSLTFFHIQKNPWEKTLIIMQTYIHTYTYVHNFFALHLIFDYNSLSLPTTQNNNNSSKQFRTQLNSIIVANDGRRPAKITTKPTSIKKSDRRYQKQTAANVLQ